jgi:formylglycine-generating enzyme required for sulfatase activity
MCRLLTEAEWEYAARAGTTTAYWWGNHAGRGNANCDGCGSQQDNKKTAPVGSFGANAFGLHDMLGNVWQWVEDCWHKNYDGAPSNDEAWTSPNCDAPGTLRGGSWYSKTLTIRSAERASNAGADPDRIGFRVARTLGP